MSNTPINWALFVEYIQSANRIVLTSHVRPDGDSIGSEMAMSEMLRTLGKDVIVINAHPVPPTLKFLDPNGTIKEYKSLNQEEQDWLAGIDAVLVLDTSSWAQLAEMGSVLKRPIAKAVLDHHIPSDDLGAVSFVDSEADSTGTLVFVAAKALGVLLSKTMAESIFVAVMTDTGWLRFSSVKSSTFQTVAELVEAGAEPAAMYQALYEQESLPRQYLIGKAMSNIESYADGTLLMTHLLQSDFDYYKAVPSDCEDIINMLLHVNGVHTAFILVEQKGTGAYKLSFRSRGVIDCSELAKRFEGGGHKNAAGGLCKMPLDEAKNALYAAFSEHL